MAKLIKKVTTIIPAHDMADGQVGVIVQWGSNSEFEYRVVQRYGDDLVQIGERSGHGWTGFFSQGAIQPETHMVKLLTRGSQIEI
jgi:hypothetical protein